MADTGLDHTITFPPLDAAQSGALREALGPMVALANPLDYHTFIWTDTDAMTRTFSAIMAGTQVDMGCIICDFPRTDRCDAAAWDCIIDAAVATKRATGKPLALVATLPDACPEPFAKRIIDAGLVPLLGLGDAQAAIAAAAWLGQHAAPTQPLLLPGTATSTATATHVLGEAEAKAALAAFGLIVPTSERAKGRDTLPDALAKVPAPFVLKSEGLAHKSDQGGVALGLPTPQAAIEAARAMPGDSFLVEEMITDTLSELLIGVLRDPAHGYVLTLAAGGVLTEVLQDSTSLLLPVTAQDIDIALDGLRIAPVLRGYRGKPAAARAAIVNAVLNVQSYVMANAADVHEVEINPLLCTPTRAVAADALIRTGEPT